MKISSRGEFSILAIVLSTVLLFQNCGPAKLSGSIDTSSQTTSIEPQFTVGMKVDLDSLLAAKPETSSNILYPTMDTQNNYDYSPNCPIMGNIILKKNDFTSIVWVHGPSSTVINLGDSFAQKKNFSSDLKGTYYIFGFRGTTPYLITQLHMNPKSSAAIPSNATGAVQVAKSLIDSDSDNERILITVEAPNVDLSSIQFTLINTGEVIAGKRALLVKKKLVEKMDVEVKVADLQGQTFTQMLALATKSSGENPTSASLALTLSVNSINFGPQAINTKSVVEFIKFTNVGTLIVMFNSKFIDSGFYDFTGTGTCGDTLAPGSSCTIGVQFAPPLPGNLPATATFYSNMPNSPHRVQLLGVGY